MRVSAANRGTLRDDVGMKGHIALAALAMSALFAACTSTTSTATSAADAAPPSSATSIPAPSTTTSVGVSVPSDDGDQALATKLAAARIRWAEAAIDGYRYSVSGYSGFAVIDADVVVVDGEATTRGTTLGLLDVEALFDFVASAIKEGEDALVARFHPDLGYTVAFSGGQPQVDAGWALVVEGFEVLDG